VTRFRSVRSRLAFSHLVVVAVGAVTVLAVGRVISPTAFDSHMATMAMSGMTNMMANDLRQSFDEAVTQALVISVAVSVVVAILAAIVATRQVAAPIDRVRAASRRLADGHYNERVEIPAELELAALADDVNHLAATLEHTELERSRLLGEVSHELRHPIATLQGYLEGMLDGVLEPSPEILSAMAGEAARLGRLAADLNLVSRVEEGSLPLEPRPLAVAALVDGIVTRLGPQFEDEDVTLRVESGPPVSTMADPDRITQILTNVIGNALSYTPAGGSVTVGWTAQAGFVDITVRDTGRGITPEDLERVFERFYRADRSAPGGTGIGLTIARALSRLHGGDLTVASSGAGGGATFTVHLPTM
jgi:signal transduction histidine kinase